MTLGACLLSRGWRCISQPATIGGLTKVEIADAQRCAVRAIDLYAPSGKRCRAALVRGNLKIGAQGNLCCSGWRDKHRIGGCGQIFYQPELVCLTSGIRDGGWNKCVAVADLNNAIGTEIDQAAQGGLSAGSWSKESQSGVHGRGRRGSGKGRGEAMSGGSCGEANALSV